MRFVLLFSCLIAVCAACSSSKPPTPEKVYDEAMILFVRKDYEDAIEAFKKVKNMFPEHPLAQTAQLLAGDANYNAEKYDEAVLSYDEFAKLYPFNINVPYARYKEAMCFYNQISEKDRDQSFTRQAAEKMAQLIKNFPDTPYAVTAREYFQESRKRIAEQEVFVGNYYVQYGKYEAAEKRFKYALKNFTDVDIQEDALYGLYTVYRERGDATKAKVFADTLTFYFPDTKYKKNMPEVMAR